MTEFSEQSSFGEIPKEKIEKVRNAMIFRDAVRKIIDLRFGDGSAGISMARDFPSREELLKRGISPQIAESFESMRQSASNEGITENSALIDLHRKSMLRLRSLEDLEVYCDANDFLWLTESQMAEILERCEAFASFIPEEEMDSIIKERETQSGS